MRESDFHKHIESRAGRGAGFPAHVLVGPGDDCAVLDLPGDSFQLITTDQLIAGKHYDSTTASVEQIARKALARSISDIAAMCGVPSAVVCTACFSDEDAPLAPELYDAMQRWAERFACPLVGGDFARGSQTLLTTTVLGTAPKAAPGPILRSGVRAGDRLWVTGRIGSSLETGHHLSFEPRIRAGLELRERLGQDLHSAIDVSDGLGRDAARLARASRVRIVIEAADVVLRVATRSVEQSVSDGEDYELLFATAPDAELPARLHDGTEVTCIGRADSDQREGRALLRMGDGSLLDMADMGWDHTGA